MKKLLIVLGISLLPLSAWAAFDFLFKLDVGPGRRTSSVGEVWVNLEPNLFWNVTSYGYSNLTTGSIRNHSFTITNSGNDIAEDVAVTLTGDAVFRLYSTVTMGNISSARSRVVKVEYHPTADGSHSCYVNYSAPNIGKTSAAITGSASTPAGGACSSGTADVTQSSNNLSSQLSATAAKGQSFQVTTAGTLYSITWNVASKGANGTAVCRVGTSANLATYLDETTINITSTGDQEVVFAAHPELATSTTYYFGCELGTALNIYAAYQGSNVYANGSFYTTGTGWSMSASAANDLRFTVKLCNP